MARLRGLYPDDQFFLVARRLKYLAKLGAMTTQLTPDRDFSGQNIDRCWPDRPRQGKRTFSGPCSHETRLLILWLLSENEKSVSEIEELLALCAGQRLLPATRPAGGLIAMVSTAAPADGGGWIHLFDFPIRKVSAMRPASLHDLLLGIRTPGSAEPGHIACIEPRICRSLEASRESGRGGMPAEGRKRSSCLIRGGCLRLFRAVWSARLFGFAARKSHFCTMAALERHWFCGRRPATHGLGAGCVHGADCHATARAPRA